MLPGGEELLRRKTHRTVSMKISVKEIERVMNDSKLKYKQLPTRGKLMLIVSLTISLYIYCKLYQIFYANDLQNESFVETDKCPACFGNSACGLLFNDQVRLTGWSKVRFLDIINVKNINFGKHWNQDVVLKKLALDSELAGVDGEICRDASREPGCDIARVIFKSSTIFALKSSPILPKYLNSNTVSMFTCGTYRLLERMWSYYKERIHQKEILYADKVQLWYISKVNTEPLLIQTFPSSEGWPFPEYYGACGRYIMVEHAGRPLNEFYNAPFEKRVDIAYQIMKMAVKMTNNEEDFILYWTDIQYENFAVDASGKVKIVDAEHIFVVDRMAVEARKPAGWDELFESRFDDCEGQNCLSFSTEQLCHHVNTDHNYYAVCRNLLSQYANEPKFPGGLLHDMPDHAQNDWQLNNLLNECVRPSKPRGRILIKEELIDALDNLRSIPAKDIDVKIVDSLVGKN